MSVQGSHTMIALVVKSAMVSNTRCVHGTLCVFACVMQSLGTLRAQEYRLSTKVLQHSWK